MTELRVDVEIATVTKVTWNVHLRKPDWLPLCSIHDPGMKAYFKARLSKRQYELARSMNYEFKRWKCRIGAPKQYDTKLTKLHLGCGDRHLEGWLNVDLWASDLNLDIANGSLPFRQEQFEDIVSQHVIEHLTIEDELIPLLTECFRCLKSGGEMWLSTPDMAKVAKSYVDQNNRDMVEDRKKRLPQWGLDGMPDQHFMNNMFHQELEHRNLFDQGMLEWTLAQAGFSQFERVDEATLLRRYPEFPPRNDDYQSIYMKATKT
ncbi:MAG: methyltransferase domain-containing protein [Cryomorphaceae bacterium]